ncbi:UDP-diphosphatase [Peptococcaceae bacterium SCADC1_2_3]|nr:UDP-diphosphatase [Peptococcaceae bacterium SCADC1_2_3]KFI35304.1 UDP-diphosphatase [Peptococcaceae bacterium SCADC1_2_3]
MSFWQSVVLGIVQGIGEFLPISSSAHLVLVPWLMKWIYAGLTFDVALHIGTLLAVVSYFWRDWLVLLRDGFSCRPTRERNLFWYLVLATIPGAFFGYVFEEQAETVFREPLLIGIMLIVMGIVLYVADRWSQSRKSLNQLTLADALGIGISQALAIIPGVSRAGITMTCGRFLGLKRETAARFSFLLSTPIVFSAGVLQLKKLQVADLNVPFITGVVVSALVGYLAIKFLLSYLTRHGFGIFVWYRLLLGVLVIIVALSRG